MFDNAPWKFTQDNPEVFTSGKQYSGNEDKSLLPQNEALLSLLHINLPLSLTRNDRGPQEIVQFAFGAEGPAFR